MKCNGSTHGDICRMLEKPAWEGSILIFRFETSRWEYIEFFNYTTIDIFSAIHMILSHC